MLKTKRKEKILIIFLFKKDGTRKATGTMNKGELLTN
jgi:hypothetical protein